MPEWKCYNVQTKVCTRGGLYLSRNEKKATFSFYSSLTIYNRWVTRRKQENGSLHDLPMETSFGHWNMSRLSQDKNPIIERIFAGNPNTWFLRCFPNRDVISSLNPPNSHDPSGGTYIRIGGLLKEK